jgi:hypothetical protein
MGLDEFIGFLIVVVLGVCIALIGRKFNNDLETLIKNEDSIQQNHNNDIAALRLLKNFKEAWTKNQLKLYFFGEGEMPWHSRIYVLFIYLLYILFILLLLILSICNLVYI